MQPVFVRHNFDSTHGVLEQLWNRRLIALHYENKFSTDPRDYEPSGAKALARLKGYCKNGAIVGADFRRLYTDKMMVGLLPPGSEVTAEEFRDPAGQSFVYKVALLESVKEVRFLEYPLLLGVQPQQATITGWASAGRVLQSIIDNAPLPEDVFCLHASQLEVLCYEYLRQRRILERLLMPIGRGLRDIDVLGIDTNGRRVLAQVTFSTSSGELEDKQARLLRQAAPADRCVFFLPRGVPLAREARVETIPVEDVLKELRAGGDVATQHMLNAMFLRE